MYWNYFLKQASNHPSFKKGFNAPTQRAFGLIELMVTISIMAIVSAVVISRQDSFNSALLLRDQTYSVALSVREVQFSAVSISGDVGGGTSAYQTVRGLQFDTANPNQYVIFAEQTPYNGWYNTGEEYGPAKILDGRFEIRAIRVGGTARSQVAVVFARPNFDAHFFTGSGTESSASSVEIDIARKGISGTGSGVLQTVEITSSGQITVK